MDTMVLPISRLLQLLHLSSVPLNLLEISLIPGNSLKHNGQDIPDIDSVATIGSYFIVLDDPAVQALSLPPGDSDCSAKLK